MPKNDPLTAYEELKGAFATDVKSVANQLSLGKIFDASCRHLSKLKKVELRSLVSCKEYFAYTDGRKVSRAVNKRLFLPDPATWRVFCRSIEPEEKSRM